MRKTDRDLLLLAPGSLVTIYALVTLVVSFIPTRAASEVASAPAAKTQVQESAPAADATAEDSERATYVQVWAERIDAFNAGYPLEGYGYAFAEAAYDYGVDPRLSPAIARVESGSGENCFAPHNAWGWGDASWDDWDTAVRSHVAGLAENYGYTLTWEMAEIYNQANVDEWYSWVASCMAEIWESDSL